MPQPPPMARTPDRRSRQRIAEGDQADAEITGGAVTDVPASRHWIATSRVPPNASVIAADGGPSKPPARRGSGYRCRRPGSATASACAIPGNRLIAVGLLPTAARSPSEGEGRLDARGRGRAPPPPRPAGLDQHEPGSATPSTAGRRAPEPVEPARRLPPADARPPTTAGRRTASTAHAGDAAPTSERRERHRHRAIAVGGALEAEDDVVARRERGAPGSDHRRRRADGRRARAQPGSSRRRR